MDLSKNPETDSASDIDEDDDDAISGDDNASSENDTTSKSIPSSFSISNLSKPHMAEVGTTSGMAATPHGLSEMREYAMNTMRELLGIYGLTSDVAESISRQLPIAAFSSGE